MSKPSIGDSVGVLIEELVADEDYLISWHANIACAAVDNDVPYDTAQKIASTFLSTLTTGKVNSLELHNKLHKQDIK